MDRVIKHKSGKTFSVGYNGDDVVKNTSTITISGSNFVFQAQNIPAESAQDNEELKRLMAASLRDIIQFIES